MKLLITTVAFLLVSGLTFAQDGSIVKIIDDLTLNWDNKAEKLKTYDGLKDLCRDRNYRTDITDLLDLIHHYDTNLFNIVTEKYDTNEDGEAKETIADIEDLERDYTTRAFRKFIHQECNEYNMVENSFSKEEEEYELERNRVEEELNKYVTMITGQIDLIDEHVHHLKKLE